LRKHRWKWAIAGELSKLLGITLGLNLEVQDLDFLLIDKIFKKIKVSKYYPLVNHRH
jgi:hypothetical protein